MTIHNKDYIKANVLLPYKKITAIIEVRFELETVQELCTFVRNRFKEGKDEKFMYNVLLREFQKDNTKKRSKKMHAQGFDTYQQCHVTEWNENSATNQRRNTAGLDGAAFKELRKTNTALGEICNTIKDKIGVEPFSFNILRQSSTGIQGAKETLFKYHQDVESGKETPFITVVIKLTEIDTSIQVSG